MQVTKRDGSFENFNLDKTRKVINWACENLNVNPLELESHVDLIFKSGISTETIQENLISQSLSLVNIDNTDWIRVASNLRVMTRYKMYRNINFVEYCNDNKYWSLLTGTYSQSELLEAFSWVDKERDKLYDYAGINTLISKFLFKDEPLQYLYLSSALIIASKEDNSKRLSFAFDLYNALSLKKISLPTPILAGIRKGNANLASCFIGYMGDSLDSIYETLHKIAKISKNGGGVGIYVGDIRCNGSWIQNVEGAAGGIVRWIKLINDTVTAVDQLGRRSGAVTVALPVWHYDLEEFLNLQTEHGDPRKKCFDIFPQLISCDEFNKRVKNDDDWYCFDPYEVLKVFNIDLKDTSKYLEVVNRRSELKLVKTYKAKALMKQCIACAVETGMPYIANIDTINRLNPNKHDGMILCVNLCVESFSNTSNDKWHTCSLVSQNLANIEESELPFISRLCTRLLDNVLDLCEYPIQESKNHVEAYRTIGVGVMGLADYIAKNGYTYETAYSSKFLSNTFETISFFTIKESIQLSKERGAFKKFKGSMWDTGEMIKRYHSNSNLGLNWLECQDDIKLFGIRNSQLMSPAPNTTSSLIQGCVPGALPPYDLFYYDDSSNGAIAISPPFISEYPLRYKAYRNYDMLKIADYIAEMQKWVDTGISFESLFDLTDPSIDAKSIFDFIMHAHEIGIKANYYFRWISNDNKSKKNECVSCAG